MATIRIKKYLLAGIHTSMKKKSPLITKQIKVFTITWQMAIK